MSGKTFRVMMDHDDRQHYIAAGCPTRVPWGLVEPHEDQAQRNHDQSVERLNQRGGLAPYELLAVLTGKRTREVWDMPLVEQSESLAALVAAYREPAFEALIAEHDALAEQVARLEAEKLEYQAWCRDRFDFTGHLEQRLQDVGNAAVAKHRKARET